MELLTGHWIAGREERTEAVFDVLDPATGAVIARSARGGGAEVDRAVASARQAAQGPWRRMDGAERVAILHRLADLLDKNRVRLGRLISLENGKPLALGDHEIGTAIRYCRYYAGWADKIGGRQIPVPGPHFAYTLKEPLGVVALIVPWNYPIDILARGLAPALAAGNTVVAKPAEDTPLTTLEVAKLALEAGLPPGVFNVVTGYGAEAGAALVAHPGIHGVSFCGSAATGVAIAKGAADNLIPILSLELGGKCPSLVLPDGDVDGAVDTIAGGLVYNAGQSCVARSRLLVHRPQLKRAEERLAQRLEGIRLGPGVDNLDMGPLINTKQWKAVNEACRAAEAEGARRITTNTVPANLPEGRYVAPTVYSNLRPEMSLARQEVFGPVLALLAYDTEEEGIALANDTPYGLAAELWAGSPAKAHGVAQRLNASHITINGSGGFGVEVPFGGIGKSGYGREGGEEGLWQYTRVKSVYLGIDRGE